MTPPSVHVIYEYWHDFRPYTSSFIRLIRPFTHDKVKAQVSVRIDLDYDRQPADLVILDRLWRPDINAELAEGLVEKIQESNSRLIHHLDDNFFDLILEKKGWPPAEYLPITAYLLRNAHGVIVSTLALAQRLQEYNKNILILPNQLDERLLVKRTAEIEALERFERPLVIGYMGTFTHDEDLLMILPALQAVCKRHPGKVELQIIGALRAAESKQAIADVPVRYVYPHPAEHEYPLFMPWFTSQVHWDIAIAPLRDTLFTRCKSDIKFLDYAAIGAAGIFSNSPAYTATVQHAKNGLLVENTVEAWEGALETLIGNPELRYQLGLNANRYLYAERTLAQHAPDWVAAVHHFLIGNDQPESLNNKMRQA